MAMVTAVLVDDRATAVAGIHFGIGKHIRAEHGIPAGRYDPLGHLHIHTQPVHQRIAHHHYVSTVVGMIGFGQLKERHLVLQVNLDQHQILIVVNFYYFGMACSSPISTIRVLASFTTWRLVRINPSSRIKIRSRPS